jgi:hypothetical protein
MSDFPFYYRAKDRNFLIVEHGDDFGRYAGKPMNLIPGVQDLRPLDIEELVLRESRLQNAIGVRNASTTRNKVDRDINVGSMNRRKPQTDEIDFGIRWDRVGQRGRVGE